MGNYNETQCLFMTNSDFPVVIILQSHLSCTGHILTITVAAAHLTSNLSEKLTF